MYYNYEKDKSLDLEDDMKRIFALSSVIMMLVMFNMLAAQTKIISSKHSNVTRIEQSNKSDKINFTKQDKEDSRSEKVKPVVSVKETSNKQEKVKEEKVRQNNKDDVQSNERVNTNRQNNTSRNSKEDYYNDDDEDYYDVPVTKPVSNTYRQTEKPQRTQSYDNVKPSYSNSGSQRSATTVNKVPSLSDNRNTNRVSQVKVPGTNRVSSVQAVRSNPIKIVENRVSKPSSDRISKPATVKITQDTRSSSSPSTTAIVNKITRATPVVVATDYAQNTDLVKHTNSSGSHAIITDDVTPGSNNDTQHPHYSYWDSGHNGSNWDDNHHGNNLDNDHQNNNWDNDHNDNHWNDHDGNWNNHHDHGWNDHHGYWGGYYSYHEWRRHHTYYDFAAPFYVWSYWNDYYTYSYIHQVYYSPWHQVHYAYVQPGFCFNFYWNNEVKKIRGLVVRNDWFEQNNDDNIDIDYSPYLSAGVHVHTNNCPRNGYGIIYQKSNGEYAFLHFDAYGNRIAKKMFENNRHNRKIYVEARGYKDSYNHKFRVLSMNRIKWHENVIFSFNFHNGWIFGRTA